MVSVIDLCISAHKPDAGMIAVTLCSITVIPLAIKLYKKPEMDLTVEPRITVNTHVLNTCEIQEYLAA